jgi:hypothetical protein
VTGDADGSGEADRAETDDDEAGVDAEGAAPLEEDGGVQESETAARPAETRDAIERMHRGPGRKERNIRQSRTHVREDQTRSRFLSLNTAPTKTPNRKFEDDVSTRWAMRTAYGM